MSSKLLPRVPTLTANLKDLKVAINFLYGTKIEEDKSLAEYMQSFARDLSYLPDTIKLKHIRDVWLLIKYVQTDLLMLQRQVISFLCLVFKRIDHSSSNLSQCTNVKSTIKLINIGMLL